MNQVAEQLAGMNIEQGSDFDKLDLTNFTDPARPRKEYPCLKHLKAAHVRGLVARVALLFSGYGGTTSFDRAQHKMITALATLYHLLHESG
eukprot:436560-Lingulodinium_polyedra.AAC.1